MNWFKKKKEENIPFGKVLNDTYEEYYANEYKNWHEKRAETLINIKNQMLEDAIEGRCWSHFVIFCEEKYNDKNYFEKWLRENKIKIDDISIHEQNGMRYPEINSYMFKVRWT